MISVGLRPHPQPLLQRRRAKKSLSSGEGLRVRSMSRIKKLNMTK